MPLIQAGKKIAVEVMGTFVDEPTLDISSGGVYLLQISVDLDQDHSYQVYIRRPESEPRGIVVLQRFDDQFVSELEKYINLYKVVS